MFTFRRWHNHLAFWLVYWLVNAFVSSRYDLKFERALWSELCQIPVKLIVVYIVFALPEPFAGTIPATRFFKPQLPGTKPLLFDTAMLKWLITVIVLVIIGGSANKLIMYFIINSRWYANDLKIDFWRLYHYLIVVLDIGFVVSLTLAIRFGRRFTKLRQREQLLMIEKTAAELKALRAQTNPHFLFNTLTNVYVLARRNAPETADIVLRLSNMLRYMLYDCSADRVPIQLEINMLTEYIDLEKLRFGKRLQMHSELSTDDPDQEIAPLLLLPFVENAFKHGASESRFDPTIELQCSLLKKNLFFKIENTIETSGTTEKSQRSGIGLDNASRQLALIYPEKYTLKTYSTDHIYTVELTIDLS